jgi:hypothetical protein
MISGKKRETQSPTPKKILSLISQYDIFRYYMPDKSWILNRATHSPFRKDNNPSFIIYEKDSQMLFIDFSDSHYRGDCFQFVQFLNNQSYNEALLQIDKDFNLGISGTKNSSLPDYKEIVSTYEQPDILEKRYAHIQVVTRKFTLEELEYWNQYHQDISDLRENCVYAVKDLYMNRQKLPVKKSEMTFGYFYDGHWKIYRPHATKTTKWVPNNVPITAMDGKSNLDSQQLVFINKSKKDYMVIKKLFPYTCAVQNEGFACFSDENLEFLKSNSNRQVLSFDSDEPGVRNSKIVTGMFEFDYCNVPRYYLQEGIKDWADLAKKYGLQIIEHYLKQKFIIP